MPRLKKNDTARDFWKQYFARQAADEYSTLVDPAHDHQADEDALRAGLAEAGWDENEINPRIEVMRGHRLPSTGHSPGVTAGVEIYFDRLCDDIEAAMGRLKIASHVKLARGIDPVAGPSAAMTNVIMTDEGIVSVSSFFFRYCGLIARAFTRTLQLNPFFWESESYSKNEGRKLLRSQPELLLYWAKAFLSFAATGTQLLAHRKPAAKHEVILFEQIARAMELFAIAHEYGHHYHSHGREVSDDPFKHELEADQFALRVLYEIEKKPFLATNPYISSGAGGLILLRSLGVLQSFSEALGAEKCAAGDTHPRKIDRISKFESVAVLKPKEFEALRMFRIVASRIMDAVEGLTLEACDVLPDEYKSKLTELRMNSFQKR